MPRKLSEQVNSLLRPFSKAIGDDKFPAIVQDVSSMLGRQQVTVIEGEWKTAAGLKLSAKDSHKMQLPMNNPAATLLWFAIRIREVETAGDFLCDATLPKACVAWVENKEAVTA